MRIVIKFLEASLSSAVERQRAARIFEAYDVCFSNAGR